MPTVPGRRKFLTTMTKAMGSTIVLTDPFRPLANPFMAPAAPITVGQVMELMIKGIPNAPFDKTVDTLKSGSSAQVVTGIVSTMFATMEVIEKTIAAGANFIIAHEPTFYNHADQTDWLENDAVFRAKHALLTKHNIALWRFHDYWHTHRPDGIMTGMLTALGWSTYSDAAKPSLLTLPPTPLRQLITHVKEKLGIKQLRVIGDTSQICKRVLFLPGAAGGRNQIAAISETKPDVVICGESSEWETPEYVRDARRQGQPLSLLVLGHIMSEAAGMEWLVTWLKPKLPDVPVRYIPSENPFTYE